MRIFLILPLSVVLLGGCHTTHKSPIYEQSTAYQGDLSTRHQYAEDKTVAPTAVTYQTAPAQTLPVQSYSIQAKTAPLQSYSTVSTITETAPTDLAYDVSDVSGTPGYMALQPSIQTETVIPENMQFASQPLPAAQIVASAPIGAAGIPIAYDYRRNLVPVDATTTGQRMTETSRVLPSVGQNYTVQQGDTVYSLSRKTCVGVNVIQSMNGLNTDFAKG